jgi:hypothetical protein
MQTSQTGVQWYSGTSSFSIPCSLPLSLSPLFTGQREIEIKREREREKEINIEKEGGRGRGREKAERAGML